jgi:membrane protein
MAPGLRHLVVRTAKEFWQDRVLGLAAEAAFWQLLSLPPLLLALLGSIGFFGGLIGAENLASVEDAILRAASKVMAPGAVATIGEPVHSVLHEGRLDVVSVGFLISIWSGSTAMATFVNTITIAYDLREFRSALKSRLLALWLYLGFVAVGVVVLPAIVLGPQLVVRLTPENLHPEVAAVVRTAYWPVVIVGALGLLTTLYHLAVPVRTRWVRGLPGSVLAFVLWLLGSAALRLYLGYVVRSSSAYSSLSAPIAVLFFFYVTALAVLIGAELNAEIDKLWPTRQTAEARERSRLTRVASGARRRWVPTLRE